MPEYTFYQLDVFTDRAFGGNPLAVFPDAGGLDPAQMQALARELNLSETTFVFPPTAPDADFKVRIFTPGGELPFAGHPVIGTHWLLAHVGRIALKPPVTTARFELGVGVRAAALHNDQGQISRVVMEHQPPSFHGTARREQVDRLAAALRLPSSAILQTGWPVQVVSTGIRQLFVPVRSLDEVQSLQAPRLDAGALSEILTELDPDDQCHDSIMVFTLETVHTWATVHTRMFAPGLGMGEDPATGSASGGLGAYLVEHGLIPAQMPDTSFTAEQGLEMGRPSRIDITVSGGPGNISMVRVGGQAVLIMKGVVHW